MNVISYPFRLDAGGQVATVEQGSDAASAEQIGLLLLIRQGERPLVPDFGVTDMVGQGLNEAELVAAITTFGPDVDIRDVDIREAGDGVQQVTVTFE